VPERVLVTERSGGAQEHRDPDDVAAEGKVLGPRVLSARLTGEDAFGLVGIDGAQDQSLSVHVGHRVMRANPGEQCNRIRSPVTRRTATFTARSSIPYDTPPTAGDVMAVAMALRRSVPRRWVPLRALSTTRRGP
jgi:hypothetical protein